MGDDNDEVRFGSFGVEKPAARPCFGNSQQVHALQLLLIWITRLVVRTAVELEDVYQRQAAEDCHFQGVESSTVVLLEVRHHDVIALEPHQVTHLLYGG